MTCPNENALTPASLATDGEQGEGAKVDGRCGAQHSPQGVAALFLVRVAMDATQTLATDDPTPGIVEAADLLGAAAQRLTEFCHPLKGRYGGEA